MFSINIYQKYKVFEIIKSSYKSYDSDANDWFKIDEYTNDYELDGIDLINKIVKNLKMEDFSDCQINNETNVIDNKVQEKLRLNISTFDPTDGTGIDYVYVIESIEMRGNENE